MSQREVKMPYRKSDFQSLVCMIQPLLDHGLWAAGGLRGLVKLFTVGPQINLGPLVLQVW